MNRLSLALLASLSLAAGCSDVKPLPSTQAATGPKEIRRGMEMSGTPEERTGRFYARTAARIEPSKHGDVKRLPVYLDFFKREFVEDTRTFACSLQSQPTGWGKAIVTGYVEFPEHQEAVGLLLQSLNLKGVRNQTELLPATELGERKYAVVTAAHAFLYDKPDGRRETLAECASGDTLFVLKAQGAALLCHGPSGYVGFIDAKNVRLIDEETLNGIERAAEAPRAAELESVIVEAKKYLGVPYVWGASSNQGIDCSGLVYSAFKKVGVMMPRDADQQYLVGRLVATRWHRAGLRRGDTLYFISRRGTIHHTAIYLGDNQYIEAAEPVVKITSFNPKDKNYDEKRDKSFCFGKRVIE